METIKVIIVDDQNLIRKGLSSILTVNIEVIFIYKS